MNDMKTCDGSCKPGQLYRDTMLPIENVKRPKGRACLLVLVMAFTASMSVACQGAPKAPVVEQPEARIGPPVIAFSGATVYSMLDERALEDAVIIVVDGRISALGRAGDIEIPAGVPVVSLAGRWIIPALADAHVHFLFNPAEPLLFLANGVAAVRDMGAPTETGKGDPSLAWDDRAAMLAGIEAGTLLSPTVYAASSVHEASSGSYFDRRLYRAVADADQAVAAVRAAKAAGYRYFKIYNKFPAKALPAAAAEAERLGMPVVGHLPHGLDAETVFAAGWMHSTEHLTPYVLPFAGYRVDPSELKRLAGLSAETGVWNVPTLEVWRNIVETDHIDDIEADPWVRYIPPSTRKIWRIGIENFNRLVGKGQSGFDRLPSSPEATEEFETVFKALHEAGAPIAAGTDAGTLNVVAGSSLRRELANYVRLGMSPYEAIGTATVDASKCMDAAGEFGVLAPGARADFVVLRADPMADIEALNTMETMVLRGVPYLRTELVAMLERMASEF